MKKLLILLIFISIEGKAQNLKTENLFLVTIDGLRWQELYTGADDSLITNTKFVQDTLELKQLFWADDPNKRRDRLFPFFWSVIAHEGQIYGNRNYGNFVNLSNSILYSYAGYSEILCGFPDDENIKNNERKNNPNKTVLEFLNNNDQFKGKVAAFGSWDVFPYIINEERSGIPVNAGFDNADGQDLTDKEILLNKLQTEIRGPWKTVRLDPFTHHYAMEYIIKNKPRVVYIAYGETDDWAHDDKYDEYLKSALQTDKYIRELWEYIQTDQQYKNRTTLVLATDHGRGEKLINWTSHSSTIKGSNYSWLAVLGPDTPALGVVKTNSQLYINQIAKTCAAFLGLDYHNDKQPGEVIKPVIQGKNTTPEPR